MEGPFPRGPSHPPGAPMTRRLSFDAHPKELAHRDSGPAHVSFFWSKRTHRAAVVLEDDETGEVVELDVRDDDDPLELYEHPYVYIGARGRRVAAA